MNLNKVVNFSYFDAEELEGISDNDTSYILYERDDDLPYYVDHQIQNRKGDRKKCIKQSNKYLEFINNVSQHLNENTCTKLKNKYISESSENFSLDQHIFYKSSPYYIFFIRLVYGDDDATVSLLGIIDTNTEEYIFLGSENEHYFVHTDLFSYADSSGIADMDLFMINPNKSDNDDNILLSTHKPEIIIYSALNTLEYIIETMDK